MHQHLLFVLRSSLVLALVGGLAGCPSPRPADDDDSVGDDDDTTAADDDDDVEDLCDNTDLSCGFYEESNSSGPNEAEAYPECAALGLDFLLEGAEDVYEFTPEADGLIDIYLDGVGPDVDVDLLVLEGGCDSPDRVCRALSVEVSGEQDSVTDLEVTAGVAILIVVDSYIEDAGGDYELILDGCGGGDDDDDDDDDDGAPPMLQGSISATLDFQNPGGAFVDCTRTYNIVHVSSGASGCPSCDARARVEYQVASNTCPDDWQSTAYWSALRTGATYMGVVIDDAEFWYQYNSGWYEFEGSGTTTGDSSGGTYSGSDSDGGFGSGYCLDLDSNGECDPNSTFFVEISVDLTW